MNQLLTDLKAVRTLLTDPARWTQLASARLADGHTIRPDGTWVRTDSEDAVSFCLLGAIRRVCRRHQDAWDALTNQLTTQSISSFNDSHTHEEVLGLIDAAIRDAQAQEGGDEHARVP